MIHLNPYILFENTQENLDKDLHMAVGADDVWEVKRILLKGANINSIRNGLTPLTLAARSNSIKSLKTLIEAGADLNKNTGTPALLYAVTFDHIECVKELIRAGADMTLRDQIWNNNFIDYAKHKADTLRWLLTYEAQELIIPKSPSLITSFIENRIPIQESIKQKYPYLFIGRDLNLL
jgi:ankyrin repeat protein